jgi:hypothetical protein
MKQAPVSTIDVRMNKGMLSPSREERKESRSKDGLKPPMNADERR